MEDTAARTRCRGCGRGLGFDEWSSGLDRCGGCAPYAPGPAASYAPGPRRPRPAAPRVAAEPSESEYEALLESLPDDVIDELVAALEAEAARAGLAPTATTVSSPPGPVAAFGALISPRELTWGAWGFAGGFAANVLLAKYAQMASGAALADFLGPMLIGGVLAGAVCGGIGWAIARLRSDPA